MRVIGLVIATLVIAFGVIVWSASAPIPAQGACGPSGCPPPTPTITPAPCTTPTPNGGPCPTAVPTNPPPHGCFVAPNGSVVCFP